MNKNRDYTINIEDICMHMKGLKATDNHKFVVRIVYLYLECFEDILHI